MQGLGRVVVATAVLAAALGGSVAARADVPDWVTCEPAVFNQPLVPNSDGTFPPDPANRFDGDQTNWSTDGLEIYVSVNGKPKTQFMIRGMNYEPTPIGGSADYSPFNDYFYTNTNDAWSPLWKRDLPLLRDLGVNAIRTYGMWKWEPGFAQPAKGTRNIGTAQYWASMSWKANDAAERDRQFCVADSFVYKHPTHEPFLDALWNGGKDPIYLWIGIAIPLAAVDPSTPTADLAAYRQFYLYTAKWLAKKYGDHPAVMGFVIGNEIDTATTVQNSLLWRLINDIHAVIKASAPKKLTATTMHDGDIYAWTITTGEYKGKTGPQIYEPDVWGVNPYTNPARPGATLDIYRKNVVENCTRPEGGSCVRPLIWGEWGVPANTRRKSTDPSKAYPLPWVAPNFVFDPNPPPQQCLAPDQQKSPPGSGGDPAAEFEAKDTSARLMRKRDGDYRLTKRLAKYYAGAAFDPGDELPAALQADWLAAFWMETRRHKADNDAPTADNDFTSGGFAFEFMDEWWKAGYPTFQSISGPATNCPAGCGNGGACQPGPANAAFPGGWGDEAWFGIHGVRTNGRQPTDPVIDPATGKLNGNPDTLVPRAAVVALCQAYRGDGCPSLWKTQR